MSGLIVLVLFVAWIARPLGVVAFALWAYGFKVMIDVNEATSSAALTALSLALWWGVGSAAVAWLVKSSLGEWLVSHRKVFENAHVAGICLGGVGMLAGFMMGGELEAAMSRSDLVALGVGYAGMFALALAYQTVAALLRPRPKPQDSSGREPSAAAR